MPCYILRAGDTEMVKIGWAEADVEGRRLALQSGHWLDLTLLRVIDGDAWIERAMHSRFIDDRVQREWFRFHPDMITVAVSELRQPTYSPHAHLINKFGGSAPMAKSIGVEPRLAIHWPRRGIPSRYWHRVIDAAAQLNPPINVTARALERLPRNDGASMEADMVPA